MGWLAAQTSRTHLLSHVSVLPYRAPLVTAKAWTPSTSSRADGPSSVSGAGHVEGEFDLLGESFADRGRELDDCLPQVRDAFEHEVVRGAVVKPRPARAGGPPIWVGGSSKPAMRRAARLGDGWLPQGPPAMGMRKAIEFILEERRAHHGAEVGRSTSAASPSPSTSATRLGRRRAHG